jgi:Gas vesicle synthesis protein GvpL/GvpF
VILCVYALVGSPCPFQKVTGIAGERLRGIPVDGAVAIVGEVRRRSPASTRNLRRYAVVVESIAARVPAILPVRFGTTFDDVAELTLALRSRGAATRQRLRAVRRRAQMTIRFVSESESADVSRASQSRAAGRARVRLEHKATQGTRYLQQRLVVLRTACEVAELAPIRPAIRRFVKDERVERRSGVITIHHLVPRAMAERYRTAVELGAAESGLRLFVSGPFAPYAFADNW